MMFFMFNIKILFVDFMVGLYMGYICEVLSKLSKFYIKFCGFNLS